MSKLIDAEKLREQIMGYVPKPLDHWFAYVIAAIDEAPDLSLTWEDIKTILVIGSDYSVELSRAGVRTKDMDKRGVYKEILKRFNKIKHGND